MKYFFLTIKHKWFVFLAGLKLHVPIWLLITHDLSKFSPSELPHYQRQFFGDKSDPSGFMKAWLHHQNSNKHHWEYWVPRSGHSHCFPPYEDNKPIRMPTKYVKEMMADWAGACRAYSGKWPRFGNYPWFDKNWNDIKLRLHPETIQEIYKELLNGKFYQIGLK